jgi:hypothetical protein
MWELESARKVSQITSPNPYSSLDLFRTLPILVKRYEPTSQLELLRPEQMYRLAHLSTFKSVVSYIRNHGNEMLKGLFTRNSCLLHVNRPLVQYGIIEMESNFTAIREENVIEPRCNFLL